ncbi:MAG: low molecular weight phosphatase family protein [Gammaproteobacteria bacterium]
MYKRKARVLFVAAELPWAAPMAAAYANALGSDWLESRCASPGATGEDTRAIAVMAEARLDLRAQAVMVLDPDLLDWADLVVTLGPAAAAHDPALASHPRRKHWPVEDPRARAGANEAVVLDGMRAERDELRRRIEGMLGGLRMLGKSDSGVAPAPDG